MPNHCDNSLWVVGRPRDVEKFLDASKNPGFGKRHEKPDWRGEFHEDRREWRIFQGNHPCPTELTDTEAAFHSDETLQSALIEKEKANLEKYGAKNWYDWCCDNWGTKWGDYDTYLNASGRNGAWFSFSTAWSPGTAGLEKISALHPELVFVNAYEEGGCDFIGCDVFYRGKTIHSGSGGFPSGPDDWDDDEQVEAHDLEMNATREKWLNKAVSKLEKKSPFHAKKLKSITRSL